MACKNIKGTVAIIFFYIFSLASCKTTSKTNVDNILASQRAIMLSDSMIEKQKKGIDFYAIGSDPVNWTLEIDFDKKIGFSADNGTRFSVSPAFEKKNITTSLETYLFRTDAGPVTIQVYNMACPGVATTESYNKKVTVTINGRLYTGCGKYLFDHRINDIWELEMINNVKQAAADFVKGLPRIQFDLEKNKMTGSDGCNSISADIEMQGNRIKFGSFTSTKMACNNDKVGKIFSGMLSDKLVDYYEENGKLVLYLIDDSKLIFIRKAL